MENNEVIEDIKDYINNINSCIKELPYVVGNKDYEDYYIDYELKRYIQYLKEDINDNQNNIEEILHILFNDKFLAKTVKNDTTDNIVRHIIKEYENNKFSDSEIKLICNLI
jgi:hypothetical protein